MSYTSDHSLSTFQLLIESCISVMKSPFFLFGIKLSLWDLFLWSIIMYVLLKVFFALFQ